MTPYPVIDVKATGENILRRRLKKGCTVLPRALLGTTVNGLVVEQ